MRREVDIERVRALARDGAGRVAIVTVPSPGLPRFVLDLAVVTAASPAYPRERRAATRVAIELAPRHPFLPPSAAVLTPVFHPHVFASGVVCVGARWVPGEGMDLYVKRLLRLLAFDPLLMNAHSIANAAAQAWYARAAQLHPQAFPTDPAAIAFATGAAAQPATPRGAEERVLRACPACGAGLRLPAGRSGNVRCPRCGQTFATSS